MEGLRIGRYELHELLGRGATAEVWRAVLHGPAGFRRQVALKLFPPAPEPDPAAVREARLGAALSHPNLAATYELGRAQHRSFLALELIEGVSALALCARDLPAGAVVEIGVQVAAALAYLHAQGLVHRDVKPSNLLVDRHGRVRLVDLGVARVAGTSAGAAGTPGYAAPEQRRGAEGAAADQHGLAASLVHLATGRAPGPDGPAAELVDAVAVRVPGLADVLTRGLARAPAQRFVDADAMGAALRVVAGRQPRCAPLADLVARAEGAVPGHDERPTERFLGNLRPSSATGFVGRQAEVRALSALLGDGAPLVVLTGPAGVGKSRLARHAVPGVLGDLDGGAWLVDLGATVTERGLCAALAEVLGVALGADPVGQLGRVVAALGRAVLVLDGFEGVAAAGAEALGRWLDAAPEATWVVTSRVRPGLRGEQQLAVPPLSADEGAALFAARAPRALDDEERAALPELVHLLDALPLALELAAARARDHRVPQLVAGMQRRFELLDRAGGSDRQRSLRASLAASWELLGPVERGALEQLCVFEAGFSLEGAEAVLSLPSDAPWTLDVLDALADHSLIGFDPTSDRFTLLSSVAAYASERVAADARLAADRAHGRWFARLGSAETLEQLGTHGGLALQAKLRAELGNLAAAVRRAAARGDPEIAVAAALAAGATTSRSGPVSLGIELLDRARDLPGAHRLGELLTARARLAYDAGDEARALCLFREALAVFQRDGDRLRVARGQGVLAQYLAYEGGFDEGDELCIAALEAHAALQDRLGAAATAVAWGTLAYAQGDYELAVERYSVAARRCRDVGDVPTLGCALTNLGHAESALSRAGPARAAYVEAVAALERAEDHINLTNALQGLGNLAADGGAFDEAFRWFGQARSWARRAGSAGAEASAAGALGRALHDAGALDEALSAYEQALALPGNPWVHCYARGGRGALLCELGRDGVGELEAALATSRAAGFPSLEAIHLRELGRVQLERGALEAAEVALDQAIALGEDGGERLGLAAALALRSRVAAAEGDAESQRRDLARAEEVAAEVSLAPASFAGKILERARSAD